MARTVLRGDRRSNAAVLPDTGWNAGLLAHRLGDRNVTTVEVDPALSARAAANLAACGLKPQLIAGDGAVGDAAGAPYDRILATCSVREIPTAWLTQSAPGGVILVPWETPWFAYGLLRLTVDEGGGTSGASGASGASGRFAPYACFMPMRRHSTDLRIFRDVVRDDQTPEESRTPLPPWAITGDEWSARFAVGLQLRNVWPAWHHAPDVPGVTSRLRLATTDTTSWAAIDCEDGREETAGRFTAWQYGPRRLVDEAEAAYAWWRDAESPGPERFGLTVAADGRHTLWLDTPEHPVPVTG
ncbi:methyltransferase [Streptomyces sp. NPDC093109]|uniref:methyltransferase n=1 Tax=Streptomyces sp. NPDC093109 TaxID=3154977 RepID=UPI00344B0F06